MIPGQLGIFHSAKLRADGPPHPENGVPCLEVMPRLPRFRGEDTSTKSPVAATTGFMSGMAPSLHAPGPRYLRDRARVAYGSDGQNSTSRALRMISSGVMSARSM